jgi:hypothetical protein
MSRNGFVQHRKTWMFPGVDFNIVSYIQKSDYDTQCWMNIMITSKSDDDSAEYIDSRLEGIFPDHRELILSGLNLSSNSIELEALLNEISHAILPEITILSERDKLMKAYAMGKFKGAAISKKFREHYLT